MPVGALLDLTGALVIADTPTNNGAIATKGYVDGRSLDVINNAKTLNSNVDISTSGYTLMVKDPGTDIDVANKRYVDAKASTLSTTTSVSLTNVIKTLDDHTKTL